MHMKLSKWDFAGHGIVILSGILLSEGASNVSTRKNGVSLILLKINRAMIFRV